MSSSSRHLRPALKNAVDVQLQTAFSDGNWASVVRLADKRLKSLKDPYYEAIKLSAQSQLDSLPDKTAVFVALDALVRNGNAVPDLDTIALYEWACGGLQDSCEYSSTFGLLRLRWAKANPRNPGVQVCLKACLQHWDLVNAQQIAVLLDKSPSSNDRRYMFWSITLTFLLSTSTQCPPGKEKLYGLLALKLLERAADVAEAADSDGPVDRGLQEEEEFNLYYLILSKLGSNNDLIKRSQSPKVGVLKQFDEGRKHLFLEALDIFKANGKWNEIYDLCRRTLSYKSEGNSPPYLAADWKVWELFIRAAGESSDRERAFVEVQEILDVFVSDKAKVAQMYKKNIALAVLELSFRLPANLYPKQAGPSGLTPRVIQLCLFLDRNYDRLSTFDDVKSYFSELTFEEARYTWDVMLPQLNNEKGETLKSISMNVLELKFRYHLSTSEQILSHMPSVVDGEKQTFTHRCRVCSKPASLPCSECMKNIITAATTLHQQINANSEVIKTIPSLEKDPRLELSFLVAMALLKLGGLGKSMSSSSPLQNVKPTRFLQAVLVLDKQLKDTPNDTPLRLLLVQLYLLLGCASEAYRLWLPMDVKRTIQDALSPLFFDRISNLSPGLFQGSRPLMEPLRAYYSATLRDESPIRIWDAFVSGSYSSILGIAEYDSQLRRSCTLVMTSVEERQATRALGGKLEGGIEEQALLENIRDDTQLVARTDYGSFPNLESSSAPPIHDVVRLGPGLSNERSHLALMVERYLDIVSWKSPKDYKPSKQHEVAMAEASYLTDILSQIHNSIDTLLQRPGTPAKLLVHEETYFTIVSLLCGIFVIALTTPRSEGLPPALSVLLSALRSALASLRAAFLAETPSGLVDGDTYRAVTTMLTLSSLRDSALATCLGVSFMLAYHERANAQDKTGKSGLHRDIITELKSVDALAAKALGEVKIRIKTLKDGFGQGGWLDKVLDWTFEGASEEGEDDRVTRAVAQVVGGRAGAEDWGGRVLESWREGVKGWANVKME